MDTTEVPDNQPTGPRRGGFRGRGRASQQKRAESYRVKKNAEFDDAIMAGIFQRLKISVPTSVRRETLAKQVVATTTPIKLTSVPEYTSTVWDTMQAVGTRPFASLDTPINRNNLSI